MTEQLSPDAPAAVRASVEAQTALQDEREDPQLGDLPDVGRVVLLYGRHLRSRRRPDRGLRHQKGARAWSGT